VEQVSEGGEGHVAEFGADLGEDDGVAGGTTRRLESGGVEGVLHAGETLGSLGSGDEGHDVGVVLLGEHLLGGAGVVLDAASTDDLPLPEVGELQLGGQGVPGLTRGVTEAKFVGVFVKLVELSDLGDDIEVSRGTLSSVKLFVVVLGASVVRGEVSTGPLSHRGEESELVLLERVSLA